MNRFAFLAIALSCLLIISHDAFCSETYYINNNRVLLYKVINWWYDCLPEQSTQLCGATIKCQSKGDAQVEYDETRRILKLKIGGGFAELLSIFKKCEQCFGPSYLKCTWLNQTYLGSAEAAMVSNELPAISAISFNKVSKDHGQRIQSIEKDLEFELQGAVGGLLNGRIALHRAGNFLKSCPQIAQGRDDSFPTYLGIINSHTKEILAKYSVIFEH